MPDAPQKPVNNAQTATEARLAARLRDNLHKRKAQARTRATDALSAASPPTQAKE